VELLRLVAAGLTDAQVAERLVLSVRTVNSYARLMYRTLGVRSRTAGTGYALRQGRAGERIDVGGLEMPIGLPTLAAAAGRSNAPSDQRAGAPCTGPVPRRGGQGLDGRSLRGRPAPSFYSIPIASNCGVPAFGGTPSRQTPPRRHLPSTRSEADRLVTQQARDLAR
jgi:Bacterial regulatory proteins, luxR family